MRRQSTGKRLRFRILERDGFRCCYCGRSPNEDPDVILNVDHVTPVAEGGRDHEDNLTTSCRDCNFGKADTILEGRIWRPRPQPVPGSPFLTWLLGQVGREDPVGDLAKEISGSLPISHGRTYREFADLIRRKTHWVAIKNTGWHAWREWNRGKPTLRTAILIAETRNYEREERATYRAEVNGKEFPPNTALFWGTSRVLKYIVARWQGALDIASLPDEKRALSRAIKSVSIAVSHEDILKAASACPVYPKFCSVWLRELAAAERDGLRVTISHRDDGTIRFKIKEDHPRLSPMDRSSDSDLVVPVVPVAGCH
jgi:HNH endonuclease